MIVLSTEDINFTFLPPTLIMIREFSKKKKKKDLLGPNLLHTKAPDLLPGRLFFQETVFLPISCRGIDGI